MKLPTFPLSTFYFLLMAVGHAATVPVYWDTATGQIVSDVTISAGDISGLGNMATISSGSFNTNLVPSIDLSFSLGSSSNRWGNVYTNKTWAAFVELGSNDTDTTLTRSSAGVVAVEGVALVKAGDDADTLGSGAATDGQVLTADGAGGSAWEDASGGSSPKIAYVHIAGQSNANAISATGGDAVPSGVGYTVKDGTIATPPADGNWTNDSAFNAGDSDSGYVPYLTMTYHGITGIPLAVGTSAYGSRPLTGDAQDQQGDGNGQHWDVRSSPAPTHASIFAPEAVTEYNTNVAALQAAGWDVVELGWIWIQGEDETGPFALLQNSTPSFSASIYGDALEALISYVRTNVSNAALPFYLVQTARTWSSSDYLLPMGIALRLEKERVAAADPLVEIIYGDTDDLYGDDPVGETYANDLHYLQPGCDRMARVMARVLAGGSHPEQLEAPDDFVSTRTDIRLAEDNHIYRDIATKYAAEYQQRTGASKLTGLIDVGTVLAAHGLLDNAAVMYFGTGRNGADADSLDLYGGLFPSGVTATKTGTPSIVAGGLDLDGSTSSIDYDLTGLDAWTEWSVFVCFEPDYATGPASSKNLWGVGDATDQITSYHSTSSTQAHSILHRIASSATVTYQASVSAFYLSADELVCQGVAANSSGGRFYTSKQYPANVLSGGGSSSADYSPAGSGVTLANTRFTIGGGYAGQATFDGTIKMVVLINKVWDNDGDGVNPSGAFYTSIMRAMINAD